MKEEKLVDKGGRKVGLESRYRKKWRRKMEREKIWKRNMERGRGTGMPRGNIEDETDA